MSIATEISRIQTGRNTIRAKLVELGMAQSTDNLDKLAAAVEAIEDRGAVSATVQEGDTYTIPKGYHNGSGTVSGVAGGGNYSLQSKTVTPTKLQQNVTPDSGYYGLSDVTVSPIPPAYQDVSAVTAEAANVLTGKIFVGPDGKTTAGTMKNNGSLIKKLDFSGTGSNTVSIPEGYHDGTGSVSITGEDKTVTPTRSEQLVKPGDGKVLRQVTIGAIPAELIDTTDADAVAANLLDGKTAYVGGVKITGTMPSNGSVSASIDGLTTTSVTVPAGHTTGGTISLSDDIETALAAI